MKEKEIQIIEAAIKLFATKGFNSTSIQEIASESGISKGAFYLHFKSKDSLLLAILKYYTERIFSKIEKIEHESLPARDKFQKQLTSLFEEIQNQREFIIMQMREQAVPFNKDIERFIRSQRSKSHQFYQRGLQAIYGSEIEEYLWDLSLILQGIFHSYFELIIFDRAQFNLGQLAGFILNRADDLVTGLKQSKEQPIFSPEMIQRASLFQNENTNSDELIEQIENVKSETNNEDLLVTLDVLKSEIESENARIPVIQGMLSNLNAHPELGSLSNRIIEYFQITKE
ncbi:TetR/AcrR family transcriptional regulator [Alkalihalobacillus sp. AL-G]|uniref:TetR/AcrR family transcriptional regulator n=1 Tax=Alkalihalobacillus sp. AL-G TaxID=2926399 RepID=UPI00272CBD29|nr:TetR/AcrR family transcriptional regulator [Alkalihalobacillus sp. AL-G]WLD93287.1 TetR/AcrR family transcriptional regulator [Alkalihalobacillus sp. AL-G]